MSANREAMGQKQFAKGHFLFILGTCLLSLLLGILYTPIWGGETAFSIQFIAHEIVAEPRGLKLWAYLSIGLGAILLAGLVGLIRPGKACGLSCIVLAGIAGVLVLIQLPPVFLWGMVLPVDAAAWLPILLHGTALFVGLCAAGLLKGLKNK
ncbi:hypothetical protein [Paenibacillus chitinolyticus]|uniref:hypothetical protein n=1 Tax=Paenibacillus TaxID=44249 RepID=UPI001C456A2E|nr:hypothetical protein [Paenibacillus chitinolyticus]MBV6716856.1 hypothetical protein [Paenibacillus chitinolyticus]